jgi:hypothetical protein
MVKSQNKHASCFVCEKEWTRRKFGVEKLKFDTLNQPRKRASKQPLNKDQETFLMVSFIQSEGGLKNLCQKHILEFAGISKGRFLKLAKKVRRPIDSAPPIFDTPRGPRIGRKLSPRVVAHVKTWLFNLSLPDPTVPGGRFIPPNLPSYRKIYGQYASEHPKGVSEFYICWESWRRVRKRECPLIKVSDSLLQTDENKQNKQKYNLLILFFRNKNIPKQLVILAAGFGQVKTLIDSG